MKVFLLLSLRHDVFALHSEQYHKRFEGKDHLNREG